MELALSPLDVFLSGGQCTTNERSLTVRKLATCHNRTYSLNCCSRSAGVLRGTECQPPGGAYVAAVRALTETVIDRDIPARVAVIVAEPPPKTGAECRRHANAPPEAFAGMTIAFGPGETLPGDVPNQRSLSARLELIESVTPPSGAGPLNATLPLTVWPTCRAGGAMTMEVSETAARGGPEVGACSQVSPNTRSRTSAGLAANTGSPPKRTTRFRALS